MSPYGEQHGRVVRTLSRDRDALQHLGMHCQTYSDALLCFGMHCPHLQSKDCSRFNFVDLFPTPNPGATLGTCLKGSSLPTSSKVGNCPRSLPKANTLAMGNNLECFICIGHSITMQYLRLTTFECCIQMLIYPSKFDLTYKTY